MDREVAGRTLPPVAGHDLVDQLGQGLTRTEHADERGRAGGNRTFAWSSRMVPVKLSPLLSCWFFASVDGGCVITDVPIGGGEGKECFSGIPIAAFHGRFQVPSAMGE